MINNDPSVTSQLIVKMTSKCEYLCPFSVTVCFNFMQRAASSIFYCLIELALDWLGLLLSFTEFFWKAPSSRKLEGLGTQYNAYGHSPSLTVCCFSFSVFILLLTILSSIWSFRERSWARAISSFCFLVRFRTVCKANCDFKCYLIVSGMIWQ